MRSYDQVDIEFVKRAPRSWSEVDYLQLGQCEFWVRQRQQHHRGHNHVLHGMIRRAREAYLGAGQPSPWTDGNYDRVQDIEPPLRAPTIAPASVPSVPRDRPMIVGDVVVPKRGGPKLTVAGIGFLQLRSDDGEDTYLAESECDRVGSGHVPKPVNFALPPKTPNMVMAETIGGNLAAVLREHGGALAKGDIATLAKERFGYTTEQVTAALRYQLKQGHIERVEAGTYRAAVTEAA